MKIIDTKENTVPFGTLQDGSICKILWPDGSKPTYAIKMSAIEVDCGCSTYNAIDLEDGDPFELEHNYMVIPLNAELRIL